MFGGWTLNSPKLTALKYHASTANRMISKMNMPRTSLNVKPSSLVPAVSLVTPFHECIVTVRCLSQRRQECNAEKISMKERTATSTNVFTDTTERWSGRVAETACASRRKTRKVLRVSSVGREKGKNRGGEKCNVAQHNAIIPRQSLRTPRRKEFLAQGTSAAKGTPRGEIQRRCRRRRPQNKGTVR